jgi:hypothetical protein
MPGPERRRVFDDVVSVELKAVAGASIPMPWRRSAQGLAALLSGSLGGDPLAGPHRGLRASRRPGWLASPMAMTGVRHLTFLSPAAWR